MKNAPETPAPVDQDELARRAVRRFAGRLKRRLERQSPDGKAIAGRDVDREAGDDVYRMAVELPRQPGQSRPLNFQVQVTVREFDGMFR